MASKQPTAGELRGLYSFQRKTDVDDGFGTVVPGAGPFAEVFKAAGKLAPLRGSESVVAGRLAGNQPYVLQIRSHAAARTITTDWQVVDVRSGAVYRVKSPISDADMKNAYLDMLVAAGPVE